MTPTPSDTRATERDCERVFVNIADAERLLRYCRAMEEENLAWRFAWDRRENHRDGYTDPHHAHNVPEKWDGSNRRCASCTNFGRIPALRAATDAARGAR